MPWAACKASTICGEMWFLSLFDDETAFTSGLLILMRFLMLNWRDPKNPSSGGAERVSLAFLRALVERGHEVFWYANEFPGSSPEETIEGIRVVRGGGRGTSVLRAVRWYKQQRPFDLVIDQHHGIPWYTPWWAKTNCVAYIHEVLGPIWNVFYPWPISMVGRWQERATHWLYRNVPFWVPSQSTRNALRRNGVREVTFIPNGTDAVPLPQLEGKPLRSPVKLVAVSRLAPNKRIDHAICVLAILSQNHVEANLTIVGAGEAEESLKRLVSEKGLTDRVTFTGAVPEDEKNAHLQSAHFLIHTSVREGWGLNVIEANAMGTPAIVYPVGGLVDSTVHEETGIVARSETPESVAAALMEILKSPEKYDTYRHKAWERSKTFQWSNVLPQACEWLETQGRKTKPSATRS